MTHGVKRNHTKFCTSIRRNRGKAERTYKENIKNNSIDKEMVINRWFCIIIRENIRLIVNKQSISEKKKNKNLHLLYSTLKPDTNSLSPSARSNGVRLNSINHKIIKGLVSIIRDQKFIRLRWWLVVLYQFQSLILPLKNIISKRSKIS